ncbi:MAG: family 10 glycosylhydrolase [Candidatus Sumerlaeota bacterium]|nr:family 10 glycosylhydrolase [Candidatus Sumerlaeota bacterium]
MIRFSLLIAAFCAFAGFAIAQTPPPLPMRPGYPLLVDFDYADDAAVAAVWEPMDETAPASVVWADQRNALRLPCNLSGNEMERASWDGKVKLDLAAVRGVQFRFSCANADPISSFVMYFHSGKGWYMVPFSFEEPWKWNIVRIEKSAAGQEGSPGGWGAIDEIRISGWRGKDQDTEFYLADLGALGGGESVAILRNEAAYRGRRAQAKDIGEYAERVGDLLEQMGVPFAVLSDLDLSADHLKNIKVAILPNCPALEPFAVETLSEYLNSGGKIVSFYSLPKALLPALGFEEGQYIKQEYAGQFASIRPEGEGLEGLPPVVEQASWNISEVKPVEGRSRIAAQWYDSAGKPTGHAAIVVSDNGAHMTHVLLSGDRDNKGQLLLAMIGRFVPDCWRTAAQASLDRVGVNSLYRSYGQFSRDVRYPLGSVPWTPPPEFHTAIELHDKGARLLKDNKYTEAIATAREASAVAVQGWIKEQKSKPGEHRAYWCHSALGVTGMTWNEAVKNLADNGFTAIFPNMLWGGFAFYDSDVLPVMPIVKEKGDQIKECLAACKKYGVQCHVWKVCWNTDNRAPKDFMEKIKSEGRTQVLFDGSTKDEWLCPSNSANQELEINAMVEVATKYDVDGIHFDYIRYSGADSCFCPGCRERFEKAIGATMKNWPADVRQDADLKKKWAQFRCDQITRVVSAVSDKVRKAKPNMKISAAVFSNWAVDRDSIGQDWKLWCEKGYLDFVCPMDYVADSRQFESLVKKQVEWAGKAGCYPGIGASVWPDADNILKVIDQIDITRRLGTGGFTIFNYTSGEARDVVPMCGMGITRK